MLMLLNFIVWWHCQNNKIKITKDNYKMETIKLYLFDTTNKKHLHREIDVSNFYVIDYANECLKFENRMNEQEIILNDWINDRGNEQHDTILTLVNWEIL